MLELYVLDLFYLNNDLKKFVRYRMEFGLVTSLIPYGVRWRKHKRTIHRHFHINAVYKYGKRNEDRGI
jgi:hypothetical protein